MGSAPGVGHVWVALDCCPLSPSSTVAQLSRLRTLDVSTIPGRVVEFRTNGRWPRLSSCTIAALQEEALQTDMILSGKSGSGVKTVDRSFRRQWGTQAHWALLGVRVTRCNGLNSWDGSVGMGHLGMAPWGDCWVGGTSPLALWTTTLKVTRMFMPKILHIPSNPSSISSKTWQRLPATGQGGGKSIL